MAWAALVVASLAIASRNPTTPAVPRLDRRTRIPSKLKVWNIRDEVSVQEHDVLAGSMIESRRCICKVKSDLWREPFKWSDLDGNKHFFGSLSQKESGLLHTEPMRYIVTTGKVTLVRPGKTPKRVQVGAIRYLPVYRDGNGNATWQIDVMVYIDQKGMPKPATVRNDEGRKIKGPLGALVFSRFKKNY